MHTYILDIAEGLDPNGPREGERTGRQTHEVLTLVW